MSRSLRVIHPGTPYHLISRFVAGEWFIQTSHERQCYLQLVGSALAESDWRCFSFAIMSNHIHLGVVAGEDTLASWLRDAHARFAEWINSRRERIGAVFVRGPKAHAVRPDGVGTLISYIHQNPVRARVVSHPAMSDWTSHAAYVGTAKSPAWLDTELGLQIGGWKDGAELDRGISSSSVQRKQLEQALQNPPKPRGRPRAQLRDVGEVTDSSRPELSSELEARMSVRADASVTAATRLVNSSLVTSALRNLIFVAAVTGCASREADITPASLVEESAGSARLQLTAFSGAHDGHAKTCFGGRIDRPPQRHWRYIVETPVDPSLAANEVSSVAVLGKADRDRVNGDDDIVDNLRAIRDGPSVRTGSN
jgi:REP element-mobilizing transposase RayT